jgi:hypothetical protein
VLDSGARCARFVKVFPTDYKRVLAEAGRRYLKQEIAA